MTTKNLVICRQFNEQDLSVINGGALGDTIKQARLGYQMTHVLLA